MPDQLTEKKAIRVFVASPGDVLIERGLVRKVVSEINLYLGASGRNVRLECVSWETHARPGVGRPQGLINSQLPPCEIFVGIMWNRFGTPTGTSGSGTQEEFDRAYKKCEETGSPQIMFYFCDKPKTLVAEQIEQREKVNAFRRSLQDGKALVWSYQNSREFTANLRSHLLGAMEEVLKRHTPPPPEEPRFTAFLASVRDLFAPVRVKIMKGLIAEGVRVVLPDDNEEANKDLIAKSNVSIHLIDGEFQPFVNKQLDQGCESAQRQIVWLSPRIDLDARELGPYLQKLRALKDKERDDVAFMQCQDTAKAIIDKVKSLKNEWLNNSSRKIFFNIRLNDKDLAEDVFKYLYEEKGIEPLTNSDDASSPTLQEFYEKASQSRAIVVFFGYVKAEWVKWQLMEVIKLAFDNSYSISRFGVYVAPPPEQEGKKEPIVLPGGFRPLWMDNTGGFDPRTVEELCMNL